MYQIQTIDAAGYPPIAGLPWNPRAENPRLQTPRYRGKGVDVPISDWSALYPETVIGSSGDLGWQNIRVLHVRHDFADIDIPPIESHCVIVQLRPSVHVTANINGHTFHDFVTPGDVAIIPAGVPSKWRWRESGPHETLHIYLEPSFVEQVAATCSLHDGQMGIEPQIAVKDEQISHMAMSLLYELKAENVVGRFYADSVASVLAIQLLRRYSCLKDVSVKKGGMAPHKLRRALEFIRENLEQQQGIPLDAVAQEVGMSRYHFSRVFKESMGVSPINYIVRQRIERAKKLLAGTDLPIADIALQSGFSGQSHFTTFFRKLVGLTPRSFRKRL